MTVAEVKNVGGRTVLDKDSSRAGARSHEASWATVRNLGLFCYS